MAQRIPSEEEVLAWMQTLSNWGRWGPDDELGTVNFVTAAKRVQAAALVKEGIAVSVAWPIGYQYAPDAPAPTRHFMLQTGESAVHQSEPRTMAEDAFLIAPHGLSITHVDGLSHFFWKGQMYNGRPSHLISSKEGAVHGSVDALGSGVSTRGVLLDIARLKGVEWLAPGTPVHAEDLEAAEAQAGLRVEPGDVLFVRTGHALYRERHAPSQIADPRAGLHASSLPFLHERGVAMIGVDSPTDVSPSGYEIVRIPVHTVGIVAMGLWLIDNCIHEELGATCARLGRWEFQVTVAPLKLQRATGCPVNPICLF